MPREIITRAKKSERRGEEKRKKKKEISNLIICLLSGHARAWEADFLHQEQKASKFSTNKLRFWQFWFFLHRQYSEHILDRLASKGRFSSKISKIKWVKTFYGRHTSLTSFKCRYEVFSGTDKSLIFAGFILVFLTMQL